MEERLRQAALIPGFMSDHELRWLAEQAADRDVVVEVGSWQGRSTKALAVAKMVWSVDNLRGIGPAFCEDIDGHFRTNLVAELDAGRVRVVREPSPEAAGRFSDADMVFIDADHDYPAPLKDIEAWARVLREGGLLCGHDCDMPDVARSLNESGLDWRPVGWGSLWCVDG